MDLGTQLDLRAADRELVLIDAAIAVGIAVRDRAAGAVVVPDRAEMAAVGLNRLVAIGRVETDLVATVELALAVLPARVGDALRVVIAVGVDARAARDALAVDRAVTRLRRLRSVRALISRGARREPHRGKSAEPDLVDHVLLRLSRMCW